MKHTHKPIPNAYRLAPALARIQFDRSPEPRGLWKVVSLILAAPAAAALVLWWLR